jgi:hypothetical protein
MSRTLVRLLYALRAYLVNISRLFCILLSGNSHMYERKVPVAGAEPRRAEDRGGFRLIPAQAKKAV